MFQLTGLHLQVFSLPKFGNLLRILNFSKKLHFWTIRKAIISGSLESLSLYFTKLISSLRLNTLSESCPWNTCEFSFKTISQNATISFFWWRFVLFLTNDHFHSQLYKFSIQLHLFFSLNFLIRKQFLNISTTFGVWSSYFSPFVSFLLNSISFSPNKDISD